MLVWLFVAVTASIAAILDLSSGNTAAFLLTLPSAAVAILFVIANWEQF